MSIMIVGADHLGNIEKYLQAYGIKEVEHICGRNASARKKVSIPQSISLVVVLTDYINHRTAINIKEQAKAQGVPMVFARRSWCSVKQQLAKYGLLSQSDCVNCKREGSLSGCRGRK